MTGTVDLNLPRGWVKTELRNICIRTTNINPTESPETMFSYFDIGGVDNEQNRIEDVKTFLGRNAPSRARQLVQQGDVLFSTVRTYLRKVARVEHAYENPIASTGFVVIRAAEGMSPDFLFFQLLSDQFLEPLHALQTGSSYPAVREKDVLDQLVVVPPTAEQERIATRLKAKFESLAKAKSAADKAQARLTRYRAAVLKAAINGELSQGWRDSFQTNEMALFRAEEFIRSLQSQRLAKTKGVEPREHQRVKAGVPKDTSYPHRRAPIAPDPPHEASDPHGWTRASIDQLSWSSGYGTSVKCTYDGVGPAVLRIPNIRNSQIETNDLKFAVTETVFKEANYVKPGDLLVIRTNGSKDLIGRAAVATSKLHTDCGFASYLIRYRLVGDETLWSWVALLWNTEQIRASVESRAATTAGQFNVSLSSLANLSIPLPPPEEQMEILRETDRRLAAADTLSAVISKQSLRVTEARKTLIAEALAGKLTDQNETDEPAAVLLERLTLNSQMKSPSVIKGKRMPKQKTKLTLARKSLVEVLSEQKQPMSPEALFAQSGYQTRFTDSECRQETVDQFYEELSHDVSSSGRIAEHRTDPNTILLELIR